MKLIISFITVMLCFIGNTHARDQIRIVGSSTVFPFSTAVAEHFGKRTKFATPVVESTGSGGGMKLFCSGIGNNYPDIVNMSRRIKKSEFDICAKNNINIIEIKIGFDGIVIANAKNGIDVSLTLEHLFLALAKHIPKNDKLILNPYIMWSDIDVSLPQQQIEIIGPPPTSGTRDAFVEIAMEKGCRNLAGAEKIGLKKKACHEIREDGMFIEGGENDNLIIQKLKTNPAAFGIFGFSFLDQNMDKIKGIAINDISPDFDSIANGKYPISRSLFFYVKLQHVDAVPGIREYVMEFTSEISWGNDGYLTDKGLIPLPDDIRYDMSGRARNFFP